MDIITHSITGAASGAVFGHPLIGMFAAVFPDIALWFKPRQESPPNGYRLLHSVPCAVLFGFVAFAFTQNLNLASAVILGWLSHTVLDLFTHSGEWAVRPIFGISSWHPRSFQEWEWFNRSWWLGLFVSIAWGALCLVIIAW